MASISGSINFLGTGSGIDIESLLTGLKQVESMQKSRMEIWKAEWQLRIDAFQEITTVMTETKSALTQFNTMNKMLKRNVASSNDKVATATADSTIDQGLYSIDVRQLATSAIYSNKTIFTGKDAKINDSPTNKTFSYTYKGVTRTIDISPNMTLEQFTKKINNDPKNPGVKASMIKNGSGYTFQIQGKETGAENTLSISSDLPSFHSVDNIMTLAYNGKETSFAVTKGMTAQDLVDLLNNRTASTGISAQLEDKGSQKVIKYYDSAGNDVTSRVGLSGGGLETFSSIGALAGVTDLTHQLAAPGSGPQNYSFTYDGKEYSVKINETGTGASIQDLLDAINAKITSEGFDDQLKASWDPGAGQISFTESKRTLEASSGQALNFSFRVGTAYKEVTKDDGSKELVKDPDSTNKLESIALSEGSSLGDLVKAFNKAATADKLAAVDPTASYEASGDSGAFEIIKTDASGAKTTLTRTKLADGTIQYKDGSVVVFETNSNINGLNTDVPASYEIPVSSGTKTLPVASSINGLDPAPVFATAETTINSGTDNWYSQQAQDARFTLNGWGQELTSSSNTLTEVVEGMTITLKSKGETNLNVVDDKEQLKENIQEVVDAINTMLKKIQELTKYDKNKTVDGPTDTDNGVLKMESQFTWQKGAALTGNYGVQLLRSRLKNVTSGAGSGFTRMQSSDDTLNDLFTSLSQIGIKTVTNESDPNFGLLEIDEAKLDEAIDRDIRNVAELFSADMQGGTNSENFSVASTGTRAKGGTYRVEYEVGSDGKLDTDSVYINGAKANYDSSMGTFTVGDMNNAAVGVSITFPMDGLTPGSYKGADADTLTIKDGKVNQMIDQLTDELRSVARDDETGFVGGQAGAIPLLIDNYKTVIASIDKKIEREETRLVTWEKRMKARFSRLDTLMTKLNGQMESNASALAQLSSNKSSS